MLELPKICFFLWFYEHECNQRTRLHAATYDRVVLVHNRTTFYCKSRPQCDLSPNKCFYEILDINHADSKNIKIFEIELELEVPGLFSCEKYFLSHPH